VYHIDNESVSQDEKHFSPSEEESLKSESEAFPCEGELLMVGRLLESQQVELEQS